MPKRVTQTSLSTPAKAKPVPLPPLSDADDLRKRFADFPAIDVISRRFDDPNDPGSLPILLKDEDTHCCVNSDHQLRLRAEAAKCHLCGKPTRVWYVRFTNTTIDGRWSVMKSKGYVPVEIAELKDEQDVADLVRGTADKYVRRGDRGQEILVKMPLELYNHIKRLQREYRNMSAASPKVLQDEITAAASAELGDEAAQSIHDGIRVESFTRSRSTLGEEAGGD